jgi:hypothetical protein
MPTSLTDNSLPAQAVPAGLQLPPRVIALTAIPFGFDNNNVAIIVQQHAAFVEELVGSRVQIVKDL